MLRKCTDCGIEAHNEEQLEIFEDRKGRPYGKGYRCKPCKSSRSAACQMGVSVEEYRWYMDNQKECIICGSTIKLVIDHNHDTSTIRGVLCNNCNTGLGMFGDSKDRMTKAIKYLEETSTYE